MCMRISLFGCEDYREYVRAKIQSRPKSGRGELMRIAKCLGIHTTTLSQILRGVRQLSGEQAFALAEYFGLNEEEARYFLLLVQYDRTGNQKLRSFLKKQLEEIEARAGELVH